jgi:spermidine synthase
MYYHRVGPVGDVFKLIGEGMANKRVGVVGLGTGTMAAYAKPGESWTFFEIDPEIVTLARDKGLFTYLKNSRAEQRIVTGDARITLVNEPDQSFDLLFLDAFTSDAIPAHLLTREAFKLYLQKLAPGGAIVVHVSNRYVDLRPVVQRIAHAEHLSFAEKSYLPDRAAVVSGADSADWVLVSRDESLTKALVDKGNWRARPGRGRAQLWTDDHSSLVGLFTFW